MQSIKAVSLANDYTSQSCWSLGPIEQLPPLVNPRPRPVNYDQQESFYAIDQQMYYHGPREYIERQRYHLPIQNQWYQTPVPQRPYPTHRYLVHQHPIQQFSPLDFNHETQTDEEPVRKHHVYAG
ncbi:Hypothetical predicted protein [Mytilus galloprovincialis]|uniref:Uncharacterized protein n=1 Tax=Mytilus galloprovincialis TaxID=29158 RepID=A0A8B6GAK4_MYTGA|nr:Hypothetical predicted protein [Mytilus galloprovincialis]